MLKKDFFRLFWFGLLFALFLSLINWPLSWYDLYLGFGVFIGIFIYDIDHLIYILYMAPHEFNSQRIKRLFDVRAYQQGIALVTETKKERTRLIFHSFIFQIALILVSLFVLTSSLSLAGKGLVLGLLFHSLLDYLRDIREDKGLNWFWQTSFKPTKEIQITICVVLSIFILFSALFLI